MKKLISILFLCLFVNANWSGYTLLTVNTNVPALHIQYALGVVGLAGRSTYTTMPHEKSQILANFSGTEYIWEVTKNDNIAPTAEYVWAGIEFNTPLTHTEVTNMILSITIFSNADEARAYMESNYSNWYTVEEL